MTMTQKAGVLLVACFAILSTYTDVRANNLMKILGVEKKYYLKDCMVRLDLLWDSEMNPSIKWRILGDIGVLMMGEMRSEKIPYFSGHTTREMKYHMFYFVDRCENRREYIQKFIEESLLPNISDFPKYEIIHENIDPGFDGITPSCCWLDN